MPKLLRKIQVNEEALGRALIILATTGGVTTLQANRLEGKYSFAYEIFYELDWMELEKLLKVYFDNASIRLLNLEDGDL